MCDLIGLVPADPPVSLEAVYPETNNWAELYVPISEFVAPLLGSKHQLCYLLAPRIKHWLKFTGKEVAVVQLEVFYLFKRPVPYQHLLEYIVVLLHRPFHSASECPPGQTH